MKYLQAANYHCDRHICFVNISDVMNIGHVDDFHRQEHISYYNVVPLLCFTSSVTLTFTASLSPMSSHNYRLQYYRCRGGLFIGRCQSQSTTRDTCSIVTCRYHNYNDSEICH